MEIQVMQNEQGIRNLYFGHPFSRETYTNSCQLKTPVELWKTDIDGIYSGKHLFLEPVESTDFGPTESELRVVRGTKSMFIGDFKFVEEMLDNVGIYHDLCNKAMVKINNPSYMDFEAYTIHVLNDPMKSVFELTSISPSQAQKYMDYAVKYDKDKKYSDKLILKPYFFSIDAGVLILTEDFMDFNLQFNISPEFGVVGCEFWLSESTSHFTHYYKDI